MKRILSGLALFVLCGAIALAEGMWTPRQIPALSGELRKMGLKIDPRRLADLTGDPMGAIVSTGGCSASFVSPQGLIVTNHHCVYSYLQYNSTADRNLLENGFLARSMAEEIPAAPDARIFVTTAIDDVTDRVAVAASEKVGDAERWQRTGCGRKALAGRGQPALAIAADPPRDRSARRPDAGGWRCRRARSRA